MAQRRMFSNKVTDTDEFLDMPHSAQNLYFHLGMHADDDGFVSNPKKIKRTINASDDDIKLLEAKKFIIPFERGICVIRHWKINNYIRNDRYDPTQYQEEKKQLNEAENGEYTVGIPDDYQLGDKVDTQVRLGKDRLGKDRTHSDDYSQDFLSFWSEYPKKIGKGEAYRAWKKIKPSQHLVGEIIDAVKKQKQSDQWTRDSGRFIPNPATWLNQRRWEDELEVKNTKYEKYDGNSTKV